jgi:hypothetical protein
MTVVAEYNISDLVRNPTEVIEQAERGQVILHRRGKADLKLMLASMQTDSSMLNEALARIAANLMERPEGRAAVEETMAKVYPWLRFLPEDAQQECTQDLIDVALACVSVRNFAAFQGKVASWRSTAEISQTQCCSPS